jgi:hypothetical protein
VRDRSPVNHPPRMTARSATTAGDAMAQ